MVRQGHVPAVVPAHRPQRQPVRHDQASRQHQRRPPDREPTIREGRVGDNDPVAPPQPRSTGDDQSHPLPLGVEPKPPASRVPGGPVRAFRRDRPARPLRRFFLRPRLAPIDEKEQRSHRRAAHRRSPDQRSPLRCGAGARRDPPSQNGDGRQHAEHAPRRRERRQHEVARQFQDHPQHQEPFDPASPPVGRPGGSSRPQRPHRDGAEDGDDRYPLQAPDQGCGIRPRRRRDERVAQHGGAGGAAHRPPRRGQRGQADHGDGRGERAGEIEQRPEQRAGPFQHRLSLLPQAAEKMRLPMTAGDERLPPREHPQRHGDGSHPAADAPKQQRVHGQYRGHHQRRVLRLHRQSGHPARGRGQADIVSVRRAQE